MTGGKQKAPAQFHRGMSFKFLRTNTIPAFLQTAAWHTKQEEEAPLQLSQEASITLLSH